MCESSSHTALQVCVKNRDNRSGADNRCTVSSELSAPSDMLYFLFSPFARSEGCSSGGLAAVSNGKSRKHNRDTNKHSILLTRVLMTKLTYPFESHSCSRFIVTPLKYCNKGRYISSPICWCNCAPATGCATTRSVKVSLMCVLDVSILCRQKRRKTAVISENGDPKLPLKIP